MQQGKTLVFIPTYNEIDNIEPLYNSIKKSMVNVDVLFCDDNSPDGTGKALDILSEKKKDLYVMHRKSKLGLGTAHIEGFNFARKNNYDFLITMDADFTHDPSYIPAMAEKRYDADIIVGSRYTAGGQMSGWNKVRLPLTYFWRNMIKHGLGMPYDCTGAFRFYNVKKLNPDVYNKVESKGFSFCMESLYRLKKNGAKIAEIPIHARSRVHGESKLSVGIMFEVAKTFFKLYADRLKSVGDNGK